MRIYWSSCHFVNQTGFLIKQYSVNCPTYAHTHDFAELVYVIRGQGSHTIGDAEYSMVPGSFFVVRPGQTHGLIFDERAEYYNIFLTESFLRDFRLDLEDIPTAWDLLCRDWPAPVVYLDAESAETVEWLCTRMNSESGSRKHRSQELIYTLFQAMLLEVQRAKDESLDAARLHQPHIALPKVLDYINAHFTEPIQLKALSEKYNYNPAYFGRLFRKRFGVTFDEYLRRKRIEYARELLENTDYSVETIMHTVGYTNKNNFYRFFTEECGCTPGEYRSVQSSTDDTLALSDTAGDAP